MTVEALMDLRERVDETLLKRRAEIETQLERMNRTIAVAGGARVVRGGRNALKGSKVPPKYRSPSGETWAGRGAIAYRLQERAFGGLDRESLRFLHGLARHGGSPRRRLKPGTVLVRDYQGQRHTVTVVSDGFDWQGATYPSLSAIARAITGTAWSGPRFFALARGNGASARRNQNASAREGRDGSQPARGMNASEMNTASLPLQTASLA